jgi:hypothetical protein
MKEKPEDHSPCLPVATLASPRSLEAQPIGFVAASGGWDISDFAAMTRDLAVQLAARAVKQFPTAKALYNFRWTQGAGYHGHGWFDGTADVYGEDGLVFHKNECA